MTSLTLSQPVIQACQDLTILVFAPGVSGAVAKLEAVMQGRRGPRVLQPYYDIAKLFRKETLVPEDASWVFLAGPVVAFTCYLVVPLLIPVLTTYPLPLGYMGDILGGGFVLALAGFAVALAAAETDGPYAQLGSSRAMTFSALIEPSILFVTFAVALITTTDLPYAEALANRASFAAAVRPAHILAALAFFLVVLNDTGRIPVETHTSTNELGMIDEARSFEHSGPALALLKWGANMKQLVLYVILLNVFVAPWGLAGTRQAGAIGLAVLTFLGKALAVGTVFALIDNSFSKLRLFKITEFMAAAFLMAVLAVLVLFLGGDGVIGGLATAASHAAVGMATATASSATPAPSAYSGLSEGLTVAILVTEFAMLRAPLSRSQIRLYSAQSLLVTTLAAYVAAARGVPDLYALAVLSLVLKVVVVPAVLLRLLRDARVELVASHRLSVASMTLLGIVLTGVGIFVIGSLPVHSSSLPSAAFGLAAAVVLVSFVLVILRSDVVSQAVGFFSLENGVSVASLVVAAGLPLVVEVAFLFDLLVAVVVFGVIMRAHHQRSSTLSTEVLNRLRG